MATGEQALQIIKRSMLPLHRRLYPRKVTDKDVVRWLETPREGVIPANLILQNRVEEVQRLLDRFPITHQEEDA